MLPITEQDNPQTANIDQVSTFDAVRLLNAEDKLVPLAVEKVLPEIAKAVDLIVERLKNGGRLFYVGTGTSGRLGVLDASEIPPTFGVSYDLVQGVIAGGYDALYKASEASEDDREAGVSDLKARGVTLKDAVIGLAASGRTPYTIGAVEYARDLGCFTACIVCVPDSAITRFVEVAIVPVVGPEPVTGSTRMKSGTAQKLVLNMISTMSMIRLGYVKGNRMTNVKSSNLKLKERSLRILMGETGSDEQYAEALLNEAAWDLRIALAMNKAAVTAEEAKKALEDSMFVVEKAVELLAESAAGSDLSVSAKALKYPIDVLNHALSLTTEWGENFQKPIDGRLLEMFPHLTEVDVAELILIAKEAESYIYSLAGKELKGELAENAIVTEALIKYPWLEQTNAYRLKNIGMFYARK